MYNSIRHKSLLVFLFFLSCSGIHASIANNNPTIKTGHPRILLLKGEERIVHQTITGNKIWREAHQSILSFCDTLIMKSPVQRILEGKRLLSQSRECLRRVFYLSYAWRMTQNEKYLRRAEKEMLAVASFSDWNPTHFLDVAEITTGLSIGYDWLYNNLSRESRTVIKEAIIKKGLEPSLNPKYTAWLSRADNWNQVCNTSMTLGSLAIYEDQPELAQRIINRAKESILQPEEAYNPDGVFNEGFGYWNFGTTYNVLFISVLEKVLGSNYNFEKIPGFLKTAGYLKNMIGPFGECFNYSDNGTSVGVHPAMFWFSNRLKDPSLLWNERKLIESYLKEHDRFLPLLIIWSYGLDIDKVAKPDENMWVGKGRNPVALMRTSWNDPNAIFVGMKGGTCGGHSHMDIGSFVMDADGVRWSMDLGPQSYYSLESLGIDLWNLSQNSQRWQVFRYNNLAHNTLTINNEYQRVNGYAPITNYSNDSSFMNAVVDLSEVYKNQLEKIKRGIGIVNKQYVVIRDEFETPAKETTLRWTLLTSANVKVSNHGMAELTKEGKKLYLKVQDPVNVEMRTWSTTSSHFYDAPNPGTTLVGFELKLPKLMKGTLTVFLIPERADKGLLTAIKSLEEWNK